MKKRRQVNRKSSAESWSKESEVLHYANIKTGPPLTRASGERKVIKNLGQVREGRDA